MHEFSAQEVHSCCCGKKTRAHRNIRLVVPVEQSQGAIHLLMPLFSTFGSLEHVQFQATIAIQQKTLFRF